jgi:hypothetical protein
MYSPNVYLLVLSKHSGTVKKFGREGWAQIREDGREEKKRTKDLLYVSCA